MKLDAQLRQEFLESIARKYLKNSSREVQRVFMTRFAYDNQSKKNDELAKILGKETVTFNRQLSAVYQAFASNGGPIDGRGAGKQKALELFRWLWNDRFPEWRQKQRLEDPEGATEPKRKLTIELEETTNIGIGMSKKKKKLVLDIDKLSPQQEQAINELLQKLTGDDSLKIEKTEKGSVVLVLGGSEAGLDRLEYLVKSGELTELLGIPIEDIRDEEPVKLSQWFRGIFETGWQQAEELLTPQQLSATVFGDRMERAKLINWRADLLSHAVVLLVNLTRESEETVTVKLKLYPTGDEGYLPENIQLQVLVDADGEKEVFEEVTARSADEWIQCRFDAEPEDEFTVRLVLGEGMVTENFAI